MRNRVICFLMAAALFGGCAAKETKPTPTPAAVTNATSKYMVQGTDRFIQQRLGRVERDEAE